MFHVKHLIPALLLFYYPVVTTGQSVFTLPDREFNPGIEINQEIFKSLEREKRFQSLSAEERDFYYWVNLLRRNPVTFLSSAVKPFLKTFPELLGKESLALEQDLLRTEPLPMLLFSNDLRLIAIEHATDLSTNGTRLSHESSRGMSFAMRMKSSGINRCAAENLYQGNNAPLFALLMLLLDMGMEVPGHRKNLLNPNYQLMGVSIQLHKSKEHYILVQDFSCQ